MEKTFQKNTIIRLAREQRKLGKTWQEVANYLEACGYTNSKGKPYTEGGIWTLITMADDPNYKSELPSANFQERRSVAHEIQKPKKVLANRDESIVHLRKSIIDLEGISADKKLELLGLTYEL
jgi:hypothetical protein